MMQSLSFARRLTVAGALGAALIAAGCAPAPAPPPPAPTTGGYAALDFAPREAYTLRIHSSAAHFSGDIRWAAARAAAESGVKITNGPAATSTAVPGQRAEIVAFVGTPCGAGAAGCAQMVIGPGKIGYSGTVSLTPRFQHSAMRRQVLLHEFGHVLGLDHFEPRFAGHHQIMRSIISANAPAAFQAGDRNGLRNRGATGRSRVAARSPIGSFDSAAPAAGGVMVRGWAADRDSFTGLELRVAVDGVATVNGFTGTHRPDVARHHTWVGPSSGFEFHVPADPGQRQVCVTAINKGWGSNRSLGCRSVTVPPHGPDLSAAAQVPLEPLPPGPEDAEAGWAPEDPHVEQHVVHTHGTLAASGLDPNDLHSHGSHSHGSHSHAAHPDGSHSCEAHRHAGIEWVRDPGGTLPLRPTGAVHGALGHPGR